MPGFIRIRPAEAIRRLTTAFQLGQPRLRPERLMSDFAHRLTDGYIRQHIPPGRSVGLEVAILDIAQDFLLTHLDGDGFFDLAVFKGGTALR